MFGNLLGPDTDSRTFDYFTETICGEDGVSRSDYTPSADDNVLVRGVSDDKYSLGYFGYVRLSHQIISQTCKRLEGSLVSAAGE